MTKKMYYTEAEAPDLLGCTIDALTDHVSDGKIRVFKDGMQTSTPPRKSTRWRLNWA